MFVGVISTEVLAVAGVAADGAAVVADTAAVASSFVLLRPGELVIIITALQ